MNTALLLRLETRRNIGLWVWPVLVGLAVLLAYGDGLGSRVTLWVQASVLVRDGLLIVGPAIAGVAAWMGGREHRRKVDDLLATTPRPAWARWSLTWAATALWGTLAYVVAGGYVLALAARQMTWGGPVAWPLLVGLVAVPAYGAVGYALGALLPNRFTAPLVAIALLVVPVVMGRGSRTGTLGPATKPSALDALHYLSPVSTLDASVWYGVRPDVGWPQALFLLGLTGLMLGGLALHDRRSLAGWSVLLSGVVLGGAAVTMLVVAVPPSALSLMTARLYAAPSFVARSHDAPVSYTPVCAGAPVPVCVHPAYQSYLAGEVQVINRLLAPLAGVPSAPTRVEQRPHYEQGVFGRTLTFVPDNGESATDQYFFGPIAQALVANYMFDGHGLSNETCPGDPTTQSCTEAQDAVGVWLVRQAGLQLHLVTSVGTTFRPYFDSHNWSRTSAAADRFGRLGQARQQAWLRAHYAALTQGRLPWQDLP